MRQLWQTFGRHLTDIRSRKFEKEKEKKNKSLKMFDGFKLL